MLRGNDAEHITLFGSWGETWLVCEIVLYLCAHTPT